MGTEPFAGREHELARLRAGLAAAREARGSAILVAGEAGIGKTRLVEELAAIAERDGALVLWGAAWDGGGAPALWPWAQVLRRLAASPLGAELGSRRDLEPILGAASPAPSVERDEVRRFRLFDALRAVLEAAAARRTIVVVIDDAHAADAATLEALAFVAREIRGTAVLLIATVRDAGERPENADALARAARAATTIRVGPLAPSAIRMLVGGAADAEAIAEITGGNPLFVAEVLHRIRADGEAASPGTSVRAVIRERVARLPADTRAALEAAAVLGREARADALAAICELSMEALEERLEPARRARILDDVPARDVRFAHALFHECARDATPRARSAALHARAADEASRALAAGDRATLEIVARHRLEALPLGDAQLAVECAERAAAAAFTAMAFDRAAELFAGALDALGRLGDDPTRRIDLALALARALVRAGDPARARALCDEAAGQARALADAPRLARAALGYGEELRLTIVDPVLVHRLEEALAGLPDGERALRARVMARLAAAQQPAVDAREPIERAKEAIALARALDDPDTILEVLNWAAAAYGGFAHPADRLALARELAWRALSRGDLVLSQRAHARAAVAAAELGLVDEIEQAAEAHERLGRALGHPRWRWNSPLLRSMCALIEGRLDDAEAAQAEAAALAAGLDDPEASATVSIHRLAALRARGEASEEEVRALEARAPEALFALGDRSRLIQAATLVRLGRVEPARRALAGVSLPLRAWQPSPFLLALSAEVAVGLGDRALAEVLLPELEAFDWPCVAWGGFLYVWEGPLAQWRGRLLVLIGRREEGAAALEEALAVAEAARAGPVAERLRHELDALRTTVTEAAAPVSGAPTFELVRDGDVWSIATAGRTAHVKHSRGVELLSELVRAPGQEFHVLDLGARPAPGAVIDRGDAGALLDEAAKRAYRARIRRLDEELREAEEWADEGRRARLAAEREALVEEIARAAGLGGRDRRAGSAAERARVNVQKRLREAIRRVGDVLPELGAHLERSVRTGIHVSYRPESPP